jgi:nucleoside-diphosphate-sugar epimerase
MEERTIAEVAEEVARCYGVAIELVPGDAPLGGTSRRCADIRKVQALGYMPRTRFSDAVAATVAWYRTHSI